MCPSSSTIVHIFSELRLHGPEVEERDLGTLQPIHPSDIKSLQLHLFTRGQSLNDVGITVS